jgi:hypothetical protein
MTYRKLSWWRWRLVQLSLGTVHLYISMICIYLSQPALMREYYYVVTFTSVSLYGMDSLGFEPWWVWDFLQPSRMAPRPTQPPVLWVPGVFLMVKQLMHGINHPLHLAPRLEKEYCYNSILSLGFHGLLQAEYDFLIFYDSCYVWNKFMLIAV